MSNDIDIDSLVFTKTSKKSYPSFPDFQEYEWFLACIDSVKVVDNKNNQSKNLVWKISILQDGFQFKHDNKIMNHCTFYNTSCVWSDKSFLKAMYCQVMGKEKISEEEKVSVKEMVGKQCYVMLYKNPKKDGNGYWVSVKLFKPYKPEQKQEPKVQQVKIEEVTKKEQPKTQNNNPDGVVSPEEIKFDAENLFKDIL